MVKNCSTLFPKAGISEVMADWPGGTYVVFHCEELDLYAIGYKYNKKKVLHFIMTPGAGSTAPGEAYQVRYSDGFGNLNTRSVLRPQVVTDYFKGSNVIDIHNQLRQSMLGLEAWETKNAWFRIDTTLIGMVVTDAFLGLKHGLPDSHSLKKVLDMCCFAALLSKQFHSKAAQLSKDVNTGTNIPMRRRGAADQSVDTTLPDSIDTSSGVSPSSTITETSVQA